MEEKRVRVRVKMLMLMLMREFGNGVKMGSSWGIVGIKVGRGGFVFWGAWVGRITGRRAEGAGLFLSFGQAALHFTK
jgi:hypothetical protein